MWLAIHLYYISGLTSRLIVLKSWIKDYFTGDRGKAESLRDRDIRPIFSESITNKLLVDNTEFQKTSCKTEKSSVFVCGLTTNN